MNPLLIIITFIFLSLACYGLFFATYKIYMKNLVSKHELKAMNSVILLYVNNFFNLEDSIKITVDHNHINIWKKDHAFCIQELNDNVSMFYVDMQIVLQNGETINKRFMFYSLYFWKILFFHKKLLKEEGVKSGLKKIKNLPELVKTKMNIKIL